MGSDDIRRELAAARVEARRLAAEQQAWREHVNELFERARDAGLTTDEIVESLGLSAKWTAHREVVRRLQLSSPPFFLYGEPGL